MCKQSRGGVLYPHAVDKTNTNSRQNPAYVTVLEGLYLRPLTHTQDAIIWRHLFSCFCFYSLSVASALPITKTAETYCWIFQLQIGTFHPEKVTASRARASICEWVWFCFMRPIKILPNLRLLPMLPSIIWSAAATDLSPKNLGSFITQIDGNNYHAIDKEKRVFGLDHKDSLKDNNRPYPIGQKKKRNRPLLEKLSICSNKHYFFKMVAGIEYSMRQLYQRHFLRFTWHQQLIIIFFLRLTEV